MTLAEKASISFVTEPGDYCFDSTGKVILACPVCGALFHCPHTVVARSPLTLSPSVIGPDRDANEQVLGPCLHHFWVKDGEALEVQ